MVSTFFAILASAAVVLASPVPEANAHQGQPASYNDPAPAPAYGGQAGQPQWQGQPQPQWQGQPQPQWQGQPQPQWAGRPQGGQWAPAAPAYPIDPPSYQSGGVNSGNAGTIIQGGGQGGVVNGGGWSQAPPAWAVPYQAQPVTYWTSVGVAPPVQYGYQQWPAPGQYPQGSPFNNGDGVSSFANTCSNTQQAVACGCDSDSSGLLGGLVSGCTLDILSPSCGQSVTCCDHQTQNGLINVGNTCGGNLLGAI